MPRGVPNWMLRRPPPPRPTPPKCPRTGRFLPPSGVKKKNTQQYKPKPPKGGTQGYYYQPPKPKGPTKPKGQWVWQADSDTDSE